MGQKTSHFNQVEIASEDFNGIVLVDRGCQTSHRLHTDAAPSEHPPSFFSRTVTHFQKRRQSKSRDKLLNVTTQTDRLDLKLRASHIGPRRNIFCGCAKKTHNKWLILQNEEYFMEYEPLENILNKKSKTLELIIENKDSQEKEIDKSSLDLKKVGKKLPKYISDKSLCFGELVGFLTDKPREIILNDLEIIEPLFESEFLHLYRAFFHKKFVLVKITELDRIEPKAIEFEENLLGDLLKESFIYERLKEIDEENICQLMSMFQMRRKNTTPFNEKALLVVQIIEYGRCSLRDVLMQRELKGEYYKERELFKILMNLCQALYLAHQKNIAHENLCPQNLVIADNFESFKIGEWGNSRLQLTDNVIVRKNNNIIEKEYLAPELYSAFPATFQIHCDPFSADVYSLGLIILEMMGFKKPEDIKVIRIAESNQGLSRFFENVGKSYPNLSKILVKMLEKNPSSRITMKELGKLLKLNNLKETESIQKILYATKVLDQNKEANFLRQHQKYLNEAVSDEDKYKKFGYKALGYFLLGETEKALKMYHTLLRFQIQAHEKSFFQNKKVLDLLDNIGCIYFYLRDYDTALKYFEESFEGKQNNSEIDVGSASSSALALSLTYYQLEQLQYALIYIEKSLNLYCQAEVDVRIQVSKVLSWKGLILSKLGQHLESLKIFLFVLKLRQEIFFQEKGHYMIADTFSDIANEHIFLGNKSDAIEYYERALFMRKIVYRSIHLEISSSLNNLGSLYDDMGDYNKALTYYEEALKVLKKINPADPEIAKIYNNIGGIYQRKRDPISSSEYFEKSLKIFEANFDHSHPTIAKSMLGLGNNYFSKGLIDKSYESYSKGLLILNRLDSEEFLDLARLKSGLGNCYRIFKQSLLALEAYEQSLWLYEEHYIFKATEISDLCSNIANCYLELEDLDHALEFFEKCLEIRKKVLEENHLDLALVYDNLSEVYRRKGDEEKRRKFWEMNIAIKKKIFGENSALLEMERVKFEKGELECEIYNLEDIES